MNFTPKTEEELQAELLLPEGIYDVEVLKAEDKISQNTNIPMIQFLLKVWDTNGQEHLRKDWLMLDKLWKVRNFCVATDMLDKYESGQVDAIDCVGKITKAKFRISKDKNGNLQNSVASYVKNEHLPTEPSSQGLVQPQDKFDDDIPF